VANANIENVIIYTSLGSEVKTVAKQNQIDVSTLLSGDYFVRIVTDKGIVTKSIIVVK
ncbi:MAG: T9SS type A sorting domain-containing protein, partial [Bacteroidales bacterium]|nr:T9SS type A sorting domain-containing protein [Bacteroidales bacterium]